eukprot:scaffold154_cov373-Prasinococcus_capsulatus_cf.AAC.17
MFSSTCAWRRHPIPCRGPRQFPVPQHSGTLLSPLAIVAAAPHRGTGAPSHRLAVQSGDRTPSLIYEVAC